jgi:hypothetical protein
VHHQNHAERQVQTLHETAARLAFPGWTPGPDDWTHTYTGFTPEGAPCTEVAVYRGRTRIHYVCIAGDELQPFWARVLNAHADT